MGFFVVVIVLWLVCFLGGVCSGFLKYLKHPMMHLNFSGSFVA